MGELVMAVLRVNALCHVDLVFSACSVWGVKYKLKKGGTVRSHGICAGGGLLPAPLPAPLFKLPFKHTSKKVGLQGDTHHT